MPRLIDADAIGIGKANRELFETPEYADGWNAAIEIIENAKPIDAVPVVHGRWEKTDDYSYMGLTIYKCSSCKEEWVFEDMCDVDNLNYHYCPNCGAKMDLEVDGE